jgi:hypothetical protein
MSEIDIRIPVYSLVVADPVKHSHLDMQRRTRGICPGCDADWDRQEAHLTARAPILAVLKQLDRMGDRR